MSPNSCAYARRWRRVAHHLQKTGGSARIDKLDIAHPVDAGMVATLGAPLGQVMDWRLELEPLLMLRVREYLDFYTAHIERWIEVPAHDPATPPVSRCESGAALGALISLGLSQTREAALAGALVGAIAGAFADAAEEQREAKREPTDRHSDPSAAPRVACIVVDPSAR